MTSTVHKQPAKLVFPCVLRNRHTGDIWLANNKSVGVKLAHGRETSDFALGCYTELADFSNPDAWGQICEPVTITFTP